jgi:hypothetical protein
MRRIRRHLTYANVMATIAVFIALGGGTTAVALSGTDTVQSDDLGPGAQVKAPDVADNAVSSADVLNESLTGADIKNRSGVDTCQAPLTAKLGPICAGSDGVTRDFFGAVNHCAQFGLRLPSFSEARTLALNYDIPNISDTDLFWTDSSYYASTNRAWTVAENGALFAGDLGTAFPTVCVTDPQA